MTYRPDGSGQRWAGAGTFDCVKDSSEASVARWGAAGMSGLLPSVFSPAFAVPALFGTLATLALIGLYLGLVTWAQDYRHARELLWDDRYFVGAIAIGFGLQVGLFVHLRRLLAGAARGSAAAATATGTGTSSAAMIACCAHHLADALPVLGLSGAAVFLSDYRIPLMALGIAVNGAGIVFMVRLVVLRSRHVTAEEKEACHAGSGSS